MRLTFRVQTAVKKVKFDCPSCGKKARTRTFRSECTVNPFNRHADGTPLSPAEVQQQARDGAERETALFMTKPICAACEDALSWQERVKLRDQRVDLIRQARAEAAA